MSTEPQSSFRGSCAQVVLMHGAPEEVEVLERIVQGEEKGDVE